MKERPKMKKVNMFVMFAMFVTAISLSGGCNKQLIVKLVPVLPDPVILTVWMDSQESDDTACAQLRRQYYPRVIGGEKLSQVISETAKSTYFPGKIVPVREYIEVESVPMPSKYLLIYYFCDDLKYGEVTFVANSTNPRDGITISMVDGENPWQFYYRGFVALLDPSNPPSPPPPRLKPSQQAQLAPAILNPPSAPVPAPVPPPGAPASQPGTVAPAPATPAAPGSAMIDRNVFLAGLNAYRTSHQLAPVAYQANLDTAAQVWAEYNRDKGFTEPKHRHKASTVATRATAAGYRAVDVGENLARVIDPEANHVLVGWQNSPPHNAALLDPVYKDVGLFCVYAPVSPEFGPYICVLVFGNPAAVPSAPAPTTP